VTLTQNCFIIKRTFRNLSRKFPAGDERKRLQRQCALFRFIDALDVSYTRKPPDFLSGSQKLPFKQYCENLKREICNDADIEKGVVKVSVRVKSPEPDTIKMIVGHMLEGKYFKGDKLEGFIEKQTEVKKRGYPFENSKTWAPPDDKGWSITAIQYHSPAAFYKILDEWLEKVWEAVLGGECNPKLEKHLKEELKILDASAHKPTLTRTGGELIASITAMSVAGEILDEYQAIVEAELDDKIRITPEGFSWDKEWAKDYDLKELPSLKPVMPEPDDNGPD